MPTVDLSNLIRKAVSVIIRGMGSELSLFVSFAATTAALGVMVVNVFDAPYPQISVDAVHNALDFSLPIVDVLMYIVNLDSFISILDYVIVILNALFVFIPTFTAAYFAALCIYRFSSAVRNNIKEILAG